MRLMDAGPVIGQLAAVSAEELINVVQQRFGASLDCLVLVREVGKESVMVVGLTRRGEEDIKTMLEGAFAHVLEHPPDVAQEM